MPISRKTFVKSIAAATLLLPIGIKAVMGKGNKSTGGNRVDGSASNLTECASHTTVRTGLVYGGS